MDIKPKVAVIMSTYNGAKYIAEQINSILNQEDVDLNLFIRDDGSNDNTIELINSVKGNITLYSESNIGVANSFMTMLYKIPNVYEYYCFADQDDIWLSNKIINAIKKIQDMNGPVLYASSQILIDSEGNNIGKRILKNESSESMQILANNGITGCTMLWNAQLQELLKDEKRRPSVSLLKKRIHDVWVAMVASVVGRIVCDQDGYIQYRQHENNVVGAYKESVIRIWKKKLLNPEIRNGRSQLAKEVLTNYGDLISPLTGQELSICANYKKNIRARIALMKYKKMYQLSGENCLSYKIKVLVGLF